MKQDELITIAEYAKIKGCSTPAVYKRLKTSLKPYLKTVNNQNFLMRKILDDEGLNNQNTQENLQIEKSNQDSKPLTNGYKQANDEVIIEVVKSLEKQLQIKDDEIQRLHQELDAIRQQLAEAMRHNQEHTDKLSELLAQAQELNRNNQLLLAQSQQAKQLPEETGKKKRKLSWLFEK